MPDTGAVGVHLVGVVGPTASGKSELSLDLAEALVAEIVNADAFQLYRGMDIGTAKVTPKQRRGIAHHQLDVLDIADEASVAAYQRDSRRDIDAVIDRGRLPLLVGGSGLYVRAATDVLEIPPTDAAVRARLETELADVGVEALRARLAELDPAAAEAIEARNGRRIVRALEVVELTGRPFSATLPRREYLRPTLVIGLRPERALLDEQIARRTRAMWDAGLLEEVEVLRRDGLEDTRTASRAVGYAQALDQLAGRLTREEAIEATAAATRRLVRRQESWFRADPRIAWLPSDLLDAEGRCREALRLIDAAASAGGTDVAR